MENNWNELFEQKAGEMPMDDLLPGYDRQAGWQQLQPRLKQKKKATILWWPYAAALLIGILGGMFFSMHWGGDKEVAQLEAGIEQNRGKEVITQMVHDTVLVYKAPANTASNKQPFVARQVKKEQVAVHTPQPPTVVEPVIQKVPERYTVQPQADGDTTEKSAIAKNTTMPVIHLLDIDNEDRQYMVEGKKHVPASIANMVLRISPSRLPERDNAGSGPLFRNLHK